MAAKGKAKTIDPKDPSVLIPGEAEKASTVAPEPEKMAEQTTIVEEIISELLEEKPNAEALSTLKEQVQGKSIKSKSDRGTDKTIEELIKDAMQHVGPGHIFIASQCKNKRTITPSGCLRLDLALESGGLPSPDGKVIEIYGPNGSGKSTLALMHIAQFHKKYPDKLAVYVDLEQTLDTEEDLMYAKRLGVDLDRLIPIQSATGDGAIEALEQIFIHKNVDLAIIDSVKRLIPSTELAKNADDPVTMCFLARFLQMNIPRIVRIIDYDKSHRKSLICLNQVIKNPGAKGPVTVTDIAPGGNTIPHIASVRIMVNKSYNQDQAIWLDTSGCRSWKKDKPDKVTGQLGYAVNGIIVKSKISAAGAKGNTFKFKILEDKGIDTMYDLYTAGLVSGVFMLNGTSDYYYKDKHIKGLNKFIEFLEGEDRGAIAKEIMNVKVPMFKLTSE